MSGSGGDGGSGGAEFRRVSVEAFQSADNKDRWVPIDGGCSYVANDGAGQCEMEEPLLVTGTFEDSGEREPYETDLAEEIDACPTNLRAINAPGERTPGDEDRVSFGTIPDGVGCLDDVEIIWSESDDPRFLLD